MRSAIHSMLVIKECTLDLVFGPAHVVANISKFKFEPILKTTETTSA
jgi:hypothetical protein